MSDKQPHPHPLADHPLFDPDAAPDDPLPLLTARTGLVEVTDGPIDFEPVPRLRKRRNGWTPQAQRAFIDALEQCGSVSLAARAVGMSARSAYRLLYSPGGESFAEAWDQAIARGIDRLRLAALDRAINGAWVPVVRRGRVVRHEHRINDRLAIALLSGRESSVADRRERASSRRRYRRKLDSERRARAEQQRRSEQIWAEHQAILDKIEAESRDSRPKIAAVRPRIRSL